MDAQVIYIIVMLGVILVSMTLHEAMHGFMAYYLGDDTAKLQGRLTLNPIRHIDPFLTVLLPILLALSGGPIFGGAKPVPFNPARVRYDEFGAALVALAGPLTNLVLAFIGYGATVLLGDTNSSSLNSGIVGLIAYMFVSVNLGFFAFNMLPIPPLDGSRILYALAPDFIRRGMETIENYGILFVFAIVLLANNFILAYMSYMIELFTTIFEWLFGVV